MADTPRVLILSFANDFHAVALQALLRRRGAGADVVDPSSFPESASLAFRAGEGLSVTAFGYALEEYTSVWWRRVAPPRVSERIRDPEEHRFAARECREALWGALDAAGVPIHNQPDAETRAGRKPVQLAAARACGLRVPETLITNDPDEVLAFRERHGEVVYKVFSATSLMMTDTRPLTDADLPDLWRVRHAPLIFQEYVPRGREYRVTLVGDDVFAAEITIRHPGAHYDWRLDQAYGVHATRLPADLERRLRALRRRLGLSSGSVDLRETPEGEVYFLEINPGGQFLFLDVFARLPVAERFCDLLLGGVPTAAEPALAAD
jgi:glutathione synthase/RimK-type ligase-like ATP-grasp enzyme